MIAKIVQGGGFAGAVGYVMEKKDARLLTGEGVMLNDKESIIKNFITQSKMKPNVSKPVAHISLNFSAQDKNCLTDKFMVDLAQDYLGKMGYDNTQYIVVRHFDTKHPHMHLIINRIDNNGIRISDKNEKLRSTKVCKELTKKYGLYLAKGKEKVKEHRLRGPDKTKYEIYSILKDTIPNSRNWRELIVQLHRQGVKVDFKYKGKTKEIQGVKFSKNNFVFNGSKVDRQFSFSKINYQLKNNNYQSISKTEQAFWQSNETQSAQNILGGWLANTHSQYNEDFREQEREKYRRRKRKKGKGYRI
ncbi:relaxase/mobilization nuclease domain-containing protein [uncultured Draconibacterium sp.]|uniref:relaxase/mobilization nuclease domain-containing protein n=1 Tax=uncultured Draconibacterium sp. TaxID=1573823 RepID=UPI0025D0FCDF|nr:relaxase/mobilization nuclease domain-containing protein [uncultured Draconibacterium sp.]